MSAERPDPARARQARRRPHDAFRRPHRQSGRDRHPHRARRRRPRPARRRGLFRGRRRLPAHAHGRRGAPALRHGPCGLSRYRTDRPDGERRRLRRGSPGLRLPFGARGIRRRLRRGRPLLHRPGPRSSPPFRRQGRGTEGGAGGGCARSGGHRPRGIAGRGAGLLRHARARPRHDDKGACRRRRAGRARRVRRKRSRAGLGALPFGSGGRLRLRRCLCRGVHPPRPAYRGPGARRPDRPCRASGRARMQRPAPLPENRRDRARARPRPGPAPRDGRSRGAARPVGRLCQSRDLRIPGGRRRTPRRNGILLHRGQCPAAGRTHGDGGRDGGRSGGDAVPAGRRRHARRARPRRPGRRPAARPCDPGADQYGDRGWGRLRASRSRADRGL